MSLPQYPMTIRLKGGRVHHMARRASVEGLVRTLCGKLGTPSPDGVHRSLCKACAAKPNPQDCRAVPVPAIPALEWVTDAHPGLFDKVVRAVIPNHLYLVRIKDGVAELTVNRTDGDGNSRFALHTSTHGSEEDALRRAAEVHPGIAAAWARRRY